MSETTAVRVPRRFATWVSVLAALIVFAGFARTYYLKPVFDGPALTVLTHAHGLIMTLWVALFITQVRLVAVRRVDVHRKLGVAGAVLAALVLAVGAATAISAAARGVTPGPPALVFLVIPLGDLLVFAGLVGTALALRKRPDVHRRLMLASCISLLPPAIARLPFAFVQAGGPLVFFGFPDLCLIACAAYDMRKHRRLHPAFAWAVPLVIASHPLRLIVGGTDAWMKFATWLVR